MLQITKSRGDSVAWSNNAFVLASTASENTDNEGETWHLLICDESQKLSTTKIKKELRPMLASTHGPFIQIGTATASKAYFFKTIESSVEREREDGIRRHFQTDYQGVITQRRHAYEEEVSRFDAFRKMRPAQQKLALEADPLAGEAPNDVHLEYERFIEDELRDLHGDIDDEAFKTNFRLLWADNRMIAIPEHIWESLAIPNLEMNLPGVKGHITAGLDVAKGDSEKSDQTVLTIMLTDIDHPLIDEKAIVAPGEEPPVHYVKTVIGLYTFRGDFEEVQYDGIIDALRLYPTLRYLVIDSTGMGDPVYSRLRDLLPDIQVEGVSWSHFKMKSDIYKRLLMECKAARLRYAAGPETRTTREFDDMNDQVTGLEKKFIGQSSVMVCEAPEGDHDDYPDSIALAIYASHRSFEEEIPEPEEAEARNFGRNTYAPSGGPVKRADAYRANRRGRSRYSRAA